MAYFEGDKDKETGRILHAKSSLENFWFDLIGQEEKCVWKHREHLESYFLWMSLIFCWTVIVPIVKMIAYFKSRGQSDHRKGRR